MRRSSDVQKHADTLNSRPPAISLLDGILDGFKLEMCPHGAPLWSTRYLPKQGKRGSGFTYPLFSKDSS